MKVDVRANGDVSGSELLFEIDVDLVTRQSNYDVSTDGERILVASRAVDNDINDIQVIVNWTSLLEGNQ